MNNELLIQAFSDSGFSIAKYYVLKHGRIPHTRVYRQVDIEELLKKLIGLYPADPSEVVIEERYSRSKKDFRKSFFIYPVTEDIVVYYSPGDFGDSAVEINYSHKSDKAVLDAIGELILSCETKQSADSKIHLLCYEHQSLSLKPFKLKVPEINLELNYNDDFYPIHELIVSRFNQPDEKGIVLLHGEPGNGKTTYVRYLATMLEKRLIYVPPDLTSKIASPEFLPLLMDYPNSILVIEDAENILKERQGGDNASISNLLNLSDGLLSDCLNIQLLCSFNADISKIDKALLRKGRIIAKYEFNRLKKEKAQALAYQLGQNRIIESDSTLAEIYNNEVPDFNEKSAVIGFKS